MPKGHLSGLTRARIVDAGWFDEALTLREIGLALGFDAVTVTRNARKFGLPPRKRQWSQIKASSCARCQYVEHCQAIQATAARLPCQPVAAWDEAEMERRVDGDRVGSSNFEAVAVVRYARRKGRAG